jgi:SAM-dependent methyltransferase
VGVDAAEYGDRHAPVYDRIYDARFAPESAVRVLAAAARGGPLLELGVGTGRLAIPLAERGLVVDGIEGSPAMAARLRSQPGGGGVGVLQADLAGFRLVRTDYTVAVCAVSTLFMLRHDDQLGCLRSTAEHLAPGGQVFLEAFRPDPTRFDADGHRVEDRSSTEGGHHVVRSVHDVSARTITITHELDDGAHDVVLHYRTPEELDDLAARAGLRRTARWHDWSGTPATTASTDPVSVYTHQLT